MRGSLVAVAVGLVGAVVTRAEADANERRPTITVGAVGAVLSVPESSGPGFEPAIGQVAEDHAGPRVTLAFERPPLPYPEQRGYNVAATLVPELIAGAFLDDDRMTGMIGAGLRAELRVSQREMGLLRVSARTGMYVAARGLVIGEGQAPGAELVLGQYILFGSTGRIGYEVGGMMRRGEAMEERQGGVVGQLYLGGSL